MKIIGIGRNYLEHAKELGNETPDEPVVFLKPDTALLRNNDDFYIPDFTNEVHHEVEVVIKICKVGKNIPLKFAPNYYQEIALGIDFTARDVQNELKSKGLPWVKAKSFDYSSPISKFVKKDTLDLNNIDFSLNINGEEVQLGNTKDMMFNVNQLIHYVSSFMTLKTGDLIYTGTPSGVGKVSIGDHLEGFLDGKKMLDFSIK